jgi:uroporphyrinogen decarboxylase
VLQALQSSDKGMDPMVLKQRVGDRLCFEGEVSVQTTLPFGSPEDVRREVEGLISVLGKDGGYILVRWSQVQCQAPGTLCRTSRQVAEIACFVVNWG